MMRLVPIRRSVLISLTTLILIVIVGLVLVSPLGLSGIAHFRNNWLELSNIGQTYGAISAMLSALALGGIVASLLYQARDSRNSYEQMVRTFQLELIKLELDDPALMAAMGAPWNTGIPADKDSIREFLYVQLWVSFWAGSFATGGLPVSAVRELAKQELFHGKAGRAYWGEVGKRQLLHSEGRRKIFFGILDDEYKKVIDSGSPPVGAIRGGPAVTASRTRQRNRAASTRPQVAMVAAGVAGVLVGRFWRDARERVLQRLRSVSMAGRRSM